MIYLYLTSLAVYIFLEIFYVELQSEKTNAFEKRLPRLLLQALLKNLPVFEIFLREPPFHIFFHQFGLKQSLGN